MNHKEIPQIKTTPEKVSEKEVTPKKKPSAAKAMEGREKKVEKELAEKAVEEKGGVEPGTEKKARDLSFHVKEMEKMLKNEIGQLSAAYQRTTPKIIESLLKGDTEKSEKLLNYKIGGKNIIPPEIAKSIKDFTLDYKGDHEEEIQQALQPLEPEAEETKEEKVKVKIETKAEEAPVTPKVAVEKEEEEPAEKKMSPREKKEKEEKDKLMAEESIKILWKTVETFNKAMKRAGIPAGSLEQIKKEIEKRKQVKKAKITTLKGYKKVEAKEERGLRRAGITIGETLKAKKEIKEKKEAQKEKEKEKEKEIKEKKEAPQRLGEILMDRKFIVVVHGGDLVETLEGELIPKTRTDTDAEIASSLIADSKVGKNYIYTTFVKKGESLEGTREITVFNVDTGKTYGINFKVGKDGGIKISADHHDPKKREPTSATQIIYEVFVKAKLIEKEVWKDNLVKFITEIDNLSYPLDKKYLKEDWWRSLYGLHKVLPSEFIREQFKKGRDPREPFERKEAEKIVFQRIKKVIKKKDEKGKVKIIEKPKTLWDLCEANRRMMNFSIKGVSESLDEMAAEKIIRSQTKELGKVVINNVGVNKKNKIPSGFDIPRSMDIETQINFYKKGFFMSSLNNLESLYKQVKKRWPETELVRGAMMFNFKEEIYHDEFKELLGLKKEYREGKRFWGPKEKAVFIVTKVIGRGKEIKYEMENQKTGRWRKLTKSQLEKELQGGSMAELKD